MKKVLLGLLLLVSANVSAGSAYVHWLEIDNYTDFMAGDFVDNEKYAVDFFETIERDIKELSTDILPSDYSVVIVFKDVDLAGHIQPTTGSRTARVIQEEQPPRFSVGYKVLDDKGNELVAKGAIVTDKKFRFRSNSGSTFQHERRTIRQWLSKELKAAIDA